VLKTLENYLTDAPTRDWLLEPLWRQLGHDRRFSKIFIASIIGHLVFYAVLIRLDLKMEFAAPRPGQPQELVKIIEVSPPPGKSSIQQSALEPPERADLSQLKYDPNNSNDRNLISRSPNPTTARGVETKLPSASQIEKQVQATRGKASTATNTTASATNNSGSPAPRPPITPEVKAAETPQPSSTITAQTIPQPTTPTPPAPSAPKPSEATAKADTQPATSAGTPGGTGNQSRAFGTQELEAQYAAYIRARIKKINERIYPKELIKDLLDDRVSADFLLIIRRGGEIASLKQLRSTGFSALDNIARQAIQTAKPFDNYPSNAGDTITLTVTVYYAPLR
jgi:outer membrane biosynthesis protein TonB